MTDVQNRAGFSLLELLIIIAIVAMISAALIPQFTQIQPGYSRKQFITKLNTLVQFGLQQTVVSQKVHRIVFDFNKRNIYLEQEAEKSTEQKPVFEAIKQGFISSSFIWPDSIKIKQLKVEGYDELKRFVGGKTDTVWFYLVPNGMAQAVTINFSDTDQLINNKPKQIGLVLNPFMVQFKVHDAFQ